MNGTGITWRELHDFLERQGFRDLPGKGTHVTMRHPSTGAEIGTCYADKDGDVSVKHLAEVARHFGRNLHDMLIWMGRKPPGKSKLTKARTADAEAQRPNDDIAALSSRGLRVCRLIHESGTCRKANETERQALRKLVSQLEQWKSTTEKALS